MLTDSVAQATVIIIIKTESKGGVPLASIFKRSGCASYHVDFVDTAGIIRRVLGFSDRDATEQLGRMIERAVAIRQAGDVLAGDMLRWLDTLRPAVRDNLAKWNIIDPQRAAAGRPIKEHIEEWAAMLEAKGNCVQYIKEARSRMLRLAEGCKWRGISDVTAVAAQRWLADRRKGDGMAAATSNGFVRCMKSFFNWLVAERRLTENPLAHVTMMNARADRRLIRRALTVEEIGRLLAATMQADKHHGMTGAERALLYRLALETGLRWSELRSLRRASFDFAGTPATVTILPENEKAGRGDTLPLRTELAADLKAHLSLRLPAARAFNMWVNGCGGRMIARDLAAAGIPKIDESGCTSDFHSLRHTFGTLLAASGVHPKVAQDLMRHSTITLTMGIYTHTTLDNRAGALDKLPALRAAGGEASLIQPENGSATG